MKFELGNGLVVRITATVSFFPVFSLFRLFNDVVIGDIETRFRRFKKKQILFVSQIRLSDKLFESID